MCKPLEDISPWLPMKILRLKIPRFEFSNYMQTAQCLHAMVPVDRFAGKVLRHDKTLIKDKTFQDVMFSGEIQGYKNRAIFTTAAVNVFIYFCILDCYILVMF